MTLSNKFRRRSIRLKEYDYSQPGEYFVTICTYDHKCVLGEIVDGEMQLNEAGKIVEEEWLRTPVIRTNIELDTFVIMPNHIHGIIILNDLGRGTSRRAPTRERFGKPTSNSIPTIIRLFKSATTKRINEINLTPGAPVWQRNYYERIIRDERELNNIREYITNNVLKWAFDSSHEMPDNLYI